MQDRLRRVTASVELRDLLNLQTEDENIFVAHFFVNFDVSTIQRTDSHGPVEGEFHITRSRGFLTRRGNLLRQIGRRDNLLSERDAVVGQEDYL